VVPQLAISKLLVEQLEDLNPQWPRADFDVETERKRLLGEDVPAAVVSWPDVRT
jgi:hypothetical protein